MTQPAPLGLTPSFGFGDRIGLATPGHVLAMKRAGKGIAPIFAQQSIREMTRTGRTPQQVMEDALKGARHAGWTGPQGADADHLKTPIDVDRTAEAGFCFFTIDPSENVDPLADTYPHDALAAKFKVISGEVDWMDRYKGKVIKLPNGTKLELTEHDCLKAAVKYGRAINLAMGMASHIAGAMRRRERGFEIELSVDETPQPTTLAEHYIIAEQCLSRGMKMVSLAPRFIGDFEKGVDYKGDLHAFEKSLADHAAIAQHLGPYKLSLHSGSDKLSIYTLVARYTKGRFHVKTAGTSYLEALRVVAHHDHDLFRRLVEFARARYDHDKATYHVSATLASAPAPVGNNDHHLLEKHYLEQWSDVPAGRGFTAPGRQIMHCTFGSVLTNPALREETMAVLGEYRTTYDQLLAEHFEHHLKALQAGL
jgi:hypothetical protein